MDTPYLPQEIFKKDFLNVYEPAEDTFLLLDALEQDLEHIRKNSIICLECGSGSGIVITALSKSLEQSSHNISRIMLATDINMNACATTRKCSRFHEQPNIQIVRTDLAEALIDRLEGNVDLLIFNPPYVLTEPRELTLRNDGDINLSWAGGIDGRHQINKFLDEYVPKLLRKENSFAYLVALDKNDINVLKNYLLDKYKIQGSVVIQRRAGIESLYVIRYNYIPSD